MGTFQRRYTDDQRTAVQQAWGDRGIRPGRRIVELAAAGELTCDSDIIPAFAITEASARSIGETYVRRLQRAARKAVAQAEPRDAIEQLRRRFVAAIDGQLTDVERRQARGKHSSVKASELQGIGRMLRELAALPGAQGEPAQGKPPGARVDGKNLGGPTRGGLAGQLLATVEPRPIPAQDDVESTESDGGDGEPRAAISENTAPGERINAGDPRNGTESTSTTDNDADSAEPGAYARAQIARMRS